jgi:hypothetical protein
MHADVVDVAVRQTVDRWSHEVEEVVLFRVFPDERDGGVDSEGITDDVRKWVMHEGGFPLRWEERRRYTDAGASGASLELILTLLGGGALGVAMQEVVNYVKARTGYAEADWLKEQFKHAATDQLRDEVLSDAERAFGRGRGDLKVENIDRSPHEIRIRAQSTSTGKRLLLIKNADGTSRLRNISSD